MNSQHTLCAILDRFSDSRVVCKHSGLFRGGAEAMQELLVKRADDLRLAAGMIDDGECPEVAVKLLRAVASDAQQFAMTVEIAARTGTALSANREQSCANRAHSEEAT